MGRGDAQRFAALAAEVRPAVDGRIDQALLAVERRAGRLGIGETIAALRALMARGGKRFRAALLLAAFRGVAPRRARGAALDAAAAIELLHAYFLVQDDWMDGDRMRRGGPAVHVALARAYGGRRVGNASAILASDFAWGVALSLLLQSDAGAPRVQRALACLLQAHEQVLLGQQLDLLAGEHDVDTVHRLKTASYTARAPLLMGAILAGAPARVEQALERVAEPLGLAFQLRDDWLGVFGDPAQTGKRRAGDLRAGKRGAVAVLADAMLDRRGQQALARVFGNGRARRDELDDAIAHLERCGVRVALEERLRRLCSLARRRVRRLPLDPRGCAWLNGAVALVAAPIDDEATG